MIGGVKNRISGIALDAYLEAYYGVGVSKAMEEMGC